MIGVGRSPEARIELLGERQAADLARLPLTYSEVGRTGTPGPPPTGFSSFTRTRRLPGDQSFEQLSDTLMSWRVQSRAGLRVVASSPRVELDAVVLLRLGVGPAALRIPCRVVTVFDDVDSQGFAYGTLPGHPECGEESFVLHRDTDGNVDFSIAAFSRPATALARAGGPITGWMQHWMTSRYLHALD